jgi:hypothetical protein
MGLPESRVAQVCPVSPTQIIQTELTAIASKNDGFDYLVGNCFNDFPLTKSRQMIEVENMTKLSSISTTLPTQKSFALLLIETAQKHGWLIYSVCFGSHACQLPKRFA